MSTAPPPDWAALKNEFITGSMRLMDLAARHAINGSTMRNRANREKWQAERDAMRRAATEKVVEKTVTTIAEELEKSTKADLRISGAIRQQIGRHLKKAQDSDTTIPPKELRLLTVAAEAVQRMTRLALGATTENTGHSAPDGGPVGVATTQMTDEQLASYKAAREQLLKDF